MIYEGACQLMAFSRRTLIITRAFLLANKKVVRSSPVLHAKRFSDYAALRFIAQPSVLCFGPGLKRVPLWHSCAGAYPLTFSVQCFHTYGRLSAEEKKTPSARSKVDEKHGSVLMQFIEKKEQPKQLTVGAKGMTVILLLESREQYLLDSS